MRFARKVGLAVAGLVIGIAMGSALDQASAQEAPMAAYQTIGGTNCANRRCGSNGSCPYTQTGTYCATSSSAGGATCVTKSCGTSTYAMSVTEAMAVAAD